jgi:hypothetical protein
VPNAILAEIFSELLSLADLCRFDSAICNKKRRTLFLNCIGSESCILMGDKNQRFGSDTISWLYTRSLRIRHLRCHRVCSDTAVQIGSIGNSTHSLSIDYAYLTHDSLCIIVTGCPNLRSIELLDCGILGSITDYSIIRLVDGCPHLHTFNLTNCQNITDMGVIRLVEGCPNLYSLSLGWCNEVTDLSIIKVAEICCNLRSLKISGLSITDKSIIQLAERCHNLYSLDISYCTHITDESIIRLSKGCHNLHDLNVWGCNNISMSEDEIENLFSNTEIRCMLII